ncbi:sensor histidine kinase [Compostibacter hankyongensis]|uniref:histidine kinase n=1 Tax=Compostibacter hankyongensis TaxID=1007089 RepID=A0ABP8FL53_9BACT
MHRRLLLILFFLFIQLTAGTAARAAFIFEKIVLPPQFNGTLVLDAAYDQAGMLWLISNSGLLRYDGDKVICFNMQTVPAVNYTGFNRIMADHAGNVWLGGKEGLLRFDLKRWTVQSVAFRRPEDADAPNDRMVARIFETKDGQVLAGTKGGKLFLVRNGQLEKLFDARRFLDSSYRDCAINQINQSDDGLLWLGTAAGRLIQLDMSGKTGPVGYGLPEFRNLNIFRIACVSDAVLFNSETSTYVLDRRTGHIRRMEQPPLSTISFCELQGHTFLLTDKIYGTNGWLSVFDYPQRTWTDSILTPADVLAVTASYGNKAMLTNGVSLYTLTWQNDLIQQRMYSAARTNSIRAICKDIRGQLLVGSYQDHFVKLDPQTGTVKKMNALQPYCFLSWNADSILIGEEGSGLFWYENGRTTPVRFPKEGNGQVRLDNFVTCLQRETDAWVWVGTYHGLYLADLRHRGSPRIIQGSLAPVIQQTRISDVLALGGRRLLATDEGLFCFSMQDTIVRSFSDTLRHHGFYSLQKINNEIWAASGDLGLVILDTAGHILKTIGLKDGLAGNTVFSLKRWRDYLIAGTEHGISVIRLPAGEDTLGPQRIHNYTVYDGLPSNECNTSALFVADSLAYVGTTNGIAVFRPDRLFEAKNDTSQTPLYISVLRIEGPDKTVYVDYSLPYRGYDEIRIPAGTPFFSITIHAASATSGTPLYGQQYYRLSEKEAWHEITDRNDFSFVNMRPGSYRLELAARAADGRWIEGLFSKALYVAPLYYQTGWFRIGVLLLALCAVALLVGFVIRYQKKQLEKERSLRLKIAGDLHDDVGSMLTGMSLQADLLLHGRGGRQQEYLQRIADTGRSAVNIMGDIVWSIDPRNDDTRSLVSRLKSYAETLLFPAGIEVDFQCAGDDAPQHLPQRIRQNVMLICKEALTNICKHAGATRVSLLLSDNDGWLCITIADNGGGMPAENNGGHGLRNMQMRADAIGAVLYFPETQKGVTVKLEVPAGRKEKRNRH